MTKNTSRTDGRMDDEVRKLELISGYTQNAPGSVLVSTGDTRIICTATFEEEVPGFLKLPENGYKHGWVTAEYGMLPGSTGKRKRRERPQVDGRTQEIQRLIGRSLRSVVDLKALGRHTVWIDCDVIQADGGTRTASITGGFVALILALRQMQAEGRFKTFPVSRFLASISVGIFEGRPLLDLKYDEDVKAEVDMNVVMLDNGDYVEVQGTAEGQTFPRNQLNQLLDYAEKGIRSHLQNQKKLLGENLESGVS
ncbi:MAG: ribonuclease PH [Deltaproteobacteria bacterium]|jgi:ribonuclease PH|nr:MAG: ribonuclease PH [Deltaproteobacteria bacterium]